MWSGILLVSLSLLTVDFVSCKKFILQSDANVRSRSNHEIRHLVNASDGQVIIVKNSLPLSINFCLRQKTEVKLNDFRFSHGNSTVMFTVNLDHGQWMGTYFSPPRNGWEDFMLTGAFPVKYHLDAGWHVLKITVTYGSSPVAVDYIEFDIADNRMNDEILQCSVMCIQEGRFPFQLNTSNLPTPSVISQDSYEAKCAEVDNVNIPMFNPFIEEFSVTASLPQYKSFNNRRGDNLTNCPHLSPELWKFSNFLLRDSTPDIITENATLMFEGGNRAMGNSVYLITEFQLEGEAEGSIDSKIGNELYLKFASLPPVKINAELQYRDRSGRFSEKTTRVFDNNNLEQMWTIPDFSWTENDKNYLMVRIYADIPIKFVIEHFKLVKRPMVPDQVHTIYRSDDVIIETVVVQLSWIAPKTMTIKLNGLQVADNVTFLRFYRPVPWNHGYAQVFVLYNDANVRLLPTAPEGLDWIPFGTSVIIGQTQFRSSRPYTIISELDINPEQWEMKVFYEDGGSAKFKFSSTNDETKLVVSDINFLKDPYTHPFATVRSMYVDEGNTDVDSVKVDDKDTYDVMDKWGNLKGRSFAFHRRCISKHLTLSPDIQIDVIKTKTPSKKSNVQ